jgi:hypothetical protein
MDSGTRCGRYAVFGSFTQDLDNGRAREDNEDMTTDNMFSQLIRRPDIRQKFIGVSMYKIGVAKYWSDQISAQLAFSRASYETFTPLPPKLYYTQNDSGIVNSEFSVSARFSPGEKTIKGNRKTIRIRSSDPVVEIKLASGIPGIIGSSYEYFRGQVSLSQRFKIPRWGELRYEAYTGKIWGNDLPFMLLELHPGNELYYYNPHSFNLMNRFEFISDKWAGFSVEHRFDKKLLNLLPFLRKSNMRQFWNAKAVWGDLNKSNRAINRTEYGSYRLRTLKGNAYLELGTGLDNIFKFFRVDFVWRFAPPLKIYPGNPPPLYKNSNDPFGIFGSFHLQF